MSNPYIFKKDNTWYCMLPGKYYKEIPYINWVEDINWSVVYYKVYQSFIQGKINSQELQEWSIEKILEITANIKL